MIKHETFNNRIKDPMNNELPYFNQLSNIDPKLGGYIYATDPSQDRAEMLEIWENSKQPISVSTNDLTSHPINNLDALPFRSLLETLDMPFADNVIYTAQDISDATDDLELLAAVMANAYQLGNLSTSFFIEMDYLKKLSQPELDNLSSESQEFVNDLINSTEPFEIISYPKVQSNEGFTLLETIANSKTNTLISSIVLHPSLTTTNLLFINASNINGMSTKQIAERLKDLGKISSSVNTKTMDEIISSPQADRIKQDRKEYSNDNDEDNFNRGERIAKASVQKIKNPKKISNLIAKKLNKSPLSKKTQNQFKIYKKTFNKPNRREPENDFKPGKTKRTIYRPDLHLYLDTSGSMSIDDYTKGISATIDIAKQLHTNVYISSFSHVLSEAVLVDGMQSKSKSSLMKKILKLPVVDGGTDFENVYNDIQQRAEKSINSHTSPEYSIILSDMEYGFQSSGYTVPKYAHNTLHLAINSYQPSLERFKTELYNAGETNIDKLLFEI